MIMNYLKPISNVYPYLCSGVSYSNDVTHLDRKRFPRRFKGIPQAEVRIFKSFI